LASRCNCFCPSCPLKYPHHEMRERQRIAVSPQTAEKEAVIERARERDELEYQDALRRFTAEKSEWERMTDMARRILTGEHKAYIEALVQLGAFDESLTSARQYSSQSTAGHCWSACLQSTGDRPFHWRSSLSQRLERCRQGNAQASIPRDLSGLRVRLCAACGARGVGLVTH